MISIINHGQTVSMSQTAMQEEDEAVHGQVNPFVTLGAVNHNDSKDDVSVL